MLALPGRERSIFWGPPKSPKMLCLRHLLVWFATASMRRDQLGAAADLDIVALDQHLDLRAHEPMRNAVSNRVHIHEAVVGDLAPQASLAKNDGPRRQRLQRGALALFEALHRALVRRAVLSLISLAHPLLEVLFELGERVERATGDGVPLHELHTRLGLAFGASAIGGARLGSDVPLLAELDPRGMKANLARAAIVREDER